MAGENIAIGIIIGIFTGILIGFFIIAFKRYSQVKNSIGNIRRQGLTFSSREKQIDFIRNIDKDLKKFGVDNSRTFLSSLIPRLKKSKKNFPSAPIENYGFKLSDKKTTKKVKVKVKEKQDGKKRRAKKIRRGLKGKGRKKRSSIKK